MEQSVKTIYNKLENISFNSQGYVDLNNTNIIKPKDLVNVCNTFRNLQYETFRVFYMKENKIVGQEIITSKIPNVVIIESSIKWYEKMKNRMNRLNADGYYLAHNHTTNSAKPSEADMKLTHCIAEKIDGFLGHIIIGGVNKYSIIERNSNGEIILPKEKTLNIKILREMEEKLSHNTLYDVKILSTDELVALLKNIQKDKEYSTAILTGHKGNVRMVLDIPNKMFNQKPENLYGFFKNLGINSGSSRVFIGTQDEQTYNRIIEHIRFGTIKEAVYFDKETDKIITNDDIERKDLFEKQMKKYRDKNAR